MGCAVGIGGARGTRQRQRRHRQVGRLFFGRFRGGAAVTDLCACTPSKLKSRSNRIESRREAEPRVQHGLIDRSNIDRIDWLVGRPQPPACVADAASAIIYRLSVLLSSRKSQKNQSQSKHSGAAKESKHLSAPHRFCFFLSFGVAFLSASYSCRFVVSFFFFSFSLPCLIHRSSFIVRCVVCYKGGKQCTNA